MPGSWVVSSLRPPASRFRASWRPPAISSTMSSCSAHPREGIPRRPSKPDVCRCAAWKKRNTSRRPPLALYVSPLCMFEESVFALIRDHEVRAAKLMNRWIRGSWWGRDASSDEHLVVTKHGLLKCRSVRRKPPGEQRSRRETIEVRGTKWNFDVKMESGICGPTLETRRDEGMPTGAAPMEIPTVPPSGPLPEEQVPEMRGQGVHAKALRIRAFWSEIGRTPRCTACETLGPGTSHTRECKTYQDSWEDSRRTASAEEARGGIVGDPDTRPLDPSLSSTDPNLKRSKTTSVTDNDSLANQMDEDNFQRGPPNKSILLTGWARRLKGSEVRSRCVLKDFATTVRDDVFAPTPSPLSVRGLLLYAAWFDLRVETGDMVCAFMQADSSCEMFARPRKDKNARDGFRDYMER